MSVPIDPVYQALQEYNIQHLCHFTDEANLESIRRIGLLSTREMSRRRVTPERRGGNEWSWQADHYFGQDKYVHLCFIKRHPMSYRASQDGRIQRLYWVEVSTDVLFLNDVLLSPKVANSSGANFYAPREITRIIDLNVLFAKADWGPNNERRVKAEKSEVLVPNSVLRRYLLNI